MVRYGRSPWLERYPRSRVPAYPKLKQAHATDVVIVGGGLTGCATAYACAAAGVKVVLIEAEQIGRASSASAFGWIADAPAGGFHALEQRLGVRSARRAWQAWRRAALDFASLLRRLEVRCALEPRQSLTIARTADQAMAVKREVKTRKAAGLEAVLASGRQVQPETGTDTTAAIRTRESATLDPYRAVLGLAMAAVDRGAVVFERSPVTRIRTGPKAVDVVTAAATVSAARVIIATGRPTALFPSLARHVAHRQTFLTLTEPVPARTRKALFATGAVIVDSAEPAHHVRWVDEERLLVSGADSAAVTKAAARDKTLVQRTGQLMYELSTLYPDISGLAPAHGWDADYGETADGLPFIGPHRNFPRHLFAFGGGGAHSVTGAYLASRILLRHYLGESEPADDVFGFTRG